MNHLLLDCLALGAILSGVLVITSKNPVISVLFLISVFVNVAGYLVLLGVGFIGISYLIVYVGAVAILFLFVVMMLNLQLAELSAVGSEYTQSLPLGAIVGSLFIFELGSVLPFSYKDVGTFLGGTEGIQSLLPNLHLGLFNWFNTTFLGLEGTTLNGDVQLAFNGGVPDDHVASFLQIQSIGHMLYTTGTVWLMVASIILMLAMAGPISLSMDKQVYHAPLSVLVTTRHSTRHLTYK